MMRACGGAIDDGQTATICPWVSNVIEPQSAGGFASDVGWSELPSGPGRRYASVIHVSLWMLQFGLAARNGFCGGLVRCRAGLPFEGWPWKAGSDGAGGVDGIGRAVALPAVRATIAAPAEIAPSAPLMPGPYPRDLCDRGLVSGGARA